MRAGGQSLRLHSTHHTSHHTSHHSLEYSRCRGRFASSPAARPPFGGSLFDGVAYVCIRSTHARGAKAAGLARLSCDKQLSAGGGAVCCERGDFSESTERLTGGRCAANGTVGDTSHGRIRRRLTPTQLFITGVVNRWSPVDSSSGEGLRRTAAPAGDTRTTSWPESLDRLWSRFRRPKAASSRHQLPPSHHRRSSSPSPSLYYTSNPCPRRRPRAAGRCIPSFLRIKQTSPVRSARRLLACGSPTDPRGRLTVSPPLTSPPGRQAPNPLPSARETEREGRTHRAHHGRSSPRHQRSAAGHPHHHQGLRQRQPQEAETAPPRPRRQCAAR